MEKEFVPYEQALALKELGFDEECLKEYHLESLLNNSTGDEMRNSELTELYGESGVITAPLYQQAFRWFREKYRLNSTIIPIENEWYFLISKKGETLTLNRPRQCYRNTYEETELECLKELIEIVKNK
jgi:hypothetical protein